MRVPVCYRFRFVNMDLGDRAELFRAFKNTREYRADVLHLLTVVFVHHMHQQARSGARGNESEYDIC
jgi:hypothetical protein